MDPGDVVLAHVPAVVGGDVTVIGDGQGAAKPIGAGPALTLSCAAIATGPLRLAACSTAR